jgi:hypothetical protein
VSTVLGGDAGFFLDFNYSNVSYFSDSVFYVNEESELGEKESNGENGQERHVCFEGARF